MRSPQLWQGDVEALLSAPPGSDRLPAKGRSLTAWPQESVASEVQGQALSTRTFASFMRPTAALSPLEVRQCLCRVLLVLLLCVWTCVSEEVKIRRLDIEKVDVICVMGIA